MPRPQTAGALQTAYRRLDPLVCRVLDDFSRSRDFPPYEAVEIDDNDFATLPTWDLSTTVHGVPATHMRIELSLDSQGHPRFTLYHGGFTAQELQVLSQALAHATRVPVLLRHTADFAPLPVVAHPV